MIARSQLAAIGVTKDGIDWRLTTGRLHVVHPGVYAVGHRRVSRRGRWIAAVLACGPGAALSKRSAAARRDWPVSERGAIDVAVPDRSGRAHAGIRIHRPTALAAQDLSEVDGVPTTSVARTLVDLAGVAKRRELERALEQASHQHVLDLTAIAEVLDRVARPRGVRTLKALLRRHHDEGPTITHAEHEERFLALARHHNLPPFLMNQPITLDDGSHFSIDALFVKQRVAIELDTYATHGTPSAFQRDRNRDATLTALGYRTLRLTYDDVTRDGARTMNLISTILRR